MKPTTGLASRQQHLPKLKLRQRKRTCSSDSGVEVEMEVIFDVEVLMAVTHGGPSFGGCEGPPFAGPCCQAGSSWLELAEKVGSFCRCTKPHCLHSIALHCTALHCVAQLCTSLHLDTSGEWCNGDVKKRLLDCFRPIL